jgi:hypothetical protein
MKNLFLWRKFNRRSVIVNNLWRLIYFSCYHLHTYSPFLSELTTPSLTSLYVEKTKVISTIERGQEKLVITQLVNSPPLIEAEMLLACSQEPATDPYPGRDEFSPQIPTLFP